MIDFKALNPFKNTQLNERYIIWALAALLGITTIFDLFTAFSSPIFVLAETNILFLNFGIFALTGVNFIYMLIIIAGLKHSEKWFMIFAFVMACLLLSYGHVLGGISNITSTNKYLENPEKITEQINTFTKEQKSAYYNTFVFNNIFVPYVICLIGFSIILQLHKMRTPKRETHLHKAIEEFNKWKDY